MVVSLVAIGAAGTVVGWPQPVVDALKVAVNHVEGDDVDREQRQAQSDRRAVHALKPRALTPDAVVQRKHLGQGVKPLHLRSIKQRLHRVIALWERIKGKKGKEGERKEGVGGGQKKKTTKELVNRNEKVNGKSFLFYLKGQTLSRRSWMATRFLRFPAIRPMCSRDIKTRRAGSDSTKAIVPATIAMMDRVVTATAKKDHK